MPRLVLLCSLSVLLLPACHDMARVDSKGIKREMEERTVYHIDPDQLLQGAQDVGDRLVHRLDSAARLGRPAVDQVLARDALPMKIDVRLLPFDSLPPFRAGPKEREVLDALAYTHRQGQPVPGNIQKLEDRSFQYIKPITPADTAALALAPWVARQNFKPGMQVGIYHIRIPTKPAALQASKGLKGMK